MTAKSDADRLDGLTIQDTSPGQVVSDLAWQGTSAHSKGVLEVVERLERGEADYVVARLAGVVVGSGGVNFAPDPAAGELWQLAVRPHLQSRGIGTALIEALEERIAARGRSVAILKVETDNVRAQALYRRLGYQVIDTSVESWDVEASDGTVQIYSTDCLVMRHDITLSAPPPPPHHPALRPSPP